MPIAPSNDLQPAARDGRRPLGRAFGNVFTANLSASLGDGVARVAAPLLAVQLTDDPVLISGIAAVALLPWLFFAIPAGILLDRVDRRHALAAAGALRTLVAVGLVVLAATDALTIWWLYAVVLLYGVLETVYDGAIRAVVPSIVGRRDLARANARIEAGEIVVQQFLSQPVTSWLLAVSALWALGLGAGSYALAAVLALFLPAAAAGLHVRRRAAPRQTPASPPAGATQPDGDAPDGVGPDGVGPDGVGPDGDPNEPEPKARWRDELVAGFRFIWTSAMLRPLWILSVVTGICYSAATSTLVLFLLDRVGVPAAWYGTFMLAGALGGLTGTAVSGRLKDRFGTGRVMAAANLLELVTITLLGLFPTPTVAAVGLFVSFGCTVVWNVLVMSLRQAAIPSHLLGRVHGTWRTALWGAMPLGSLLGGLLARGDLALPMLVGGGVGLVLALGGYRLLSRLPNPEDLPASPPPSPLTA